VHGSDGRLTILGARQNRISAESWLAADGDMRKSRDALEGGFRCDPAGCAAKRTKAPDPAALARLNRQPSLSSGAETPPAKLGDEPIPEEGGGGEGEEE
jgi:competence protein ComEC